MGLGTRQPGICKVLEPSDLFRRFFSLVLGREGRNGLLRTTIGDLKGLAD